MNPPPRDTNTAIDRASPVAVKARRQGAGHTPALPSATTTNGDTMTFMLVTVILGAALILRACRPGPIPPWRATWFDIPHDTGRKARR